MREDRLALSDDCTDQRASLRQIAEGRPEQLALGADSDVKDLEAVALEHRHLLGARIMGEADDLLGSDHPGIHGAVDANSLENLNRMGVVDDRDREGNSVQLDEGGRVVVLRVVSHREDCGLRLVDVLALDELGVHAGRVEHPGVR